MTLTTLFQSTQGKPLTNFQVVKEIRDAKRHLTFYKNDYFFIIAFDCTQGEIWPPSRDWISNLFAWPKALSVGSRKYKAHAGFVDEYMSLREDIIRQIFVHQPEEIYITGFSQGGALATLCFRDVTHNNSNVSVHGTVFASPRVYDVNSSMEFEDSLKSTFNSFERINLHGDPVPSLPPWFLGFRHVFQDVRIGKFKLFPDTKVHGGDQYLKVLENR